MKVLNKIKSFFAAIVPLVVCFAGSAVVFILGVWLCYALEMHEKSAFIETISDKSTCVIMIVSFLTFFFVFLAEMKLYRLSFGDISPVKQNGMVYVFAVLFGVSAFFVLNASDMIFAQIMGTEYPMPTEKLTGELAVGNYIIDVMEPIVLVPVLFGIMPKLFNDHFPIWVGAAVSTLILIPYFAVIDLYFAIGFSVILLFIRYRFGDLKLCILIYMIMNVVSNVMKLVEAESYEVIIKTGGAVGTVIGSAAMFLMLKFAAKTEPASDNS